MLNFKTFAIFNHEEATLLLKQAFKLSYKSLYPSILDRQKVHLADNVFHDTIAALKSHEMMDTPHFTQIVHSWWDIVNNTSTIKGKIKRNELSTPFF